MLQLSKCSARKTTVLLSMMLSCIGFAQRPVRVTSPQAKPASTTNLATRFKTPAEQLMIPYLKAHHAKLSGSATVSSARPMDATSYATTPNFGGYVNAPIFPARNTASLAAGIFDTGVTVELGGDFNKDGKPDVAVLQEDGTLNILLGDGAGKLGAPVSYLNPYQQTTNVFTANVADVNGDGAPDIVAFDYANDTVITWLNLGSGTFNAAITTPLDQTNGFAAQTFLADVNGDGKADLIYTTTVSQSNTSTTIALEVQLGAGDGTFGTAADAKVQQLTIPASVNLQQQSGFTLADLNGDGKLDIALALPEDFGQNGTYVVTTALGNGDGTFGTLGTTTPISAAVAGINLGRFTIVPFTTAGIYIADVNGDGNADVVSDINGVLEVALSTGSNTFSAAVTSDESAIDDVASGAILDVNGDGKPDWVVAGGTLGIYLGKGDGTFALATGGQLIIDPVGSGSLVVGDFNGDSKQDVAQLGSDYKQVSLFFGTGTTLRGAPSVTANGDPQGIATTLVASGKYTASGYSDPLFLYSNLAGTVSNVFTGVSDGKGNFTSVAALSGGLPADLEYVQPIHADYNGDGLEDLTYANTTGEIFVALAKGDGTFGTPTAIGIGTQVCPSYYGAAGDLNGDGKVDLVIPYGGDIACGYLSGGVAGYWVALGNGDGTFAKPKFTAFGTELYSVALADMNGDGKLDLLVNDVPFFNGSGYQVTLSPGNGDGTFGTQSVVESSYIATSMATGDINGDGKPDLILSTEEVAGSDTTTAGIVAYPGNGDGTFNLPQQILTGDEFLDLQVADMNNDGNADIVAALFSTVGQPVDYYGMVTLLGYGNGQFSAPFNQLESLGSDTAQVGNFANGGAMDVMTQTGYGPALFAGQGGSTIALTTSSTSPSFGSSVTLTATITAVLTGRPTATGTVSFYDGTTLLGTGTLAAGVATYSTSSLAVGAHAVKAVYLGDGSYNPATSTTSAVTVATLAPAFTLTSGSTSVSVTQGAQGLVTLNLAANASFSGAVALSCTGAPANATCAVNPGSVTLTAGSTGTATLVIGTTGTKAALDMPNRNNSIEEAAISFGAAAAGLLFFRRRKFGKLAALTMGLLMMAGMMAMTGCSGGGSSVPSSGATSFTVQVTATPSGGSGWAQTTSISVTVN